MRRRLVRLAVVLGALLIMGMPQPASAGWTCFTTSYCNIATCYFAGATYRMRVCVDDNGNQTIEVTYLGCGCA